MFSGVAESAYFGPAEINAMRRAMKIATSALRHECGDEAGRTERLRDVARTILQLAGNGQTNPLILSATALRLGREKACSTFRPYERRPLNGRLHARRVPLARQIA